MCFGIHLGRVKVGAIVPVLPSEHFWGSPAWSAYVLERTRIIWIVFTSLHRDIPVSKFLEVVSKGPEEMIEVRSFHVQVQDTASIGRRGCDLALARKHWKS